MFFSIKHIIPAPIAEYLVNNAYHSDIWQQDFELLPQKKYLISAQSGKGKSTFTHILYGLRKDYTGEILWHDKNIAKNQKNNDQNTQKIALNSLLPADWGMLRQRKMSIVFQDLRLFLELTALENIILKNELTNTLSLKEIQDLAKKLNIMHVLHRKASTLSYGERQRVAIIRALAQPFELLLLDEPFSHLDNANIDIAQQIILDYAQKNNASILMTTLGMTYNMNFDKVFNL